MNVNAVDQNAISHYADLKQDAFQTKKLEANPRNEISSLQSEKQENVQSKFGYEALNKSIENDPIAQFISYLA